MVGLDRDYLGQYAAMAMLLRSGEEERLREALRSEHMRIRPYSVEKYGRPSTPEERRSVIRVNWYAAAAQLYASGGISTDELRKCIDGVFLLFDKKPVFDDARVRDDWRRAS